MSNTNVVIISGRLVNDAFVRDFANGGQVCKFVLANNRKYGDNERVCYIDCDYFGKQGRFDKLVGYLCKGKLVVVTGELVQDKWQKDGENRSKHAIRVTDVELMGSRSDSHGEYNRVSGTEVQDAVNKLEQRNRTSSQDDDDIPF